MLAVTNSSDWLKSVTAHLVSTLSMKHKVKHWPMTNYRD